MNHRLRSCAVVLILVAAAAAQAGTAFSVLGSYPMAATPESLTSGDWDGDGDLDLACSATNGVTVFYNDGTGAMRTSTLLAMTADPPDHLVSADVTGDGRPDLLATDHPTGSLYLWRNNGTGGFPVRSTLGLGPGCWNCTVADFNGDGWPDVAVGVDVGSFTGPDQIVVLYNARVATAPFSGALAQALAMVDPVTGARQTQPWAVAPIDLQRDGRIDLVVTLTSGTQKLVFLRNQGAGSGGTANFAAPALAANLGNNAYSIAVGDLDRNGHADIVVGLAQNISAPRHLVQVVLVNGLTFSPASSYDIGTGSPRDVDLVDLDLDLDPDILVSNRTGGNPGALARLLNDGRGGFSIPGTTTTALAPIQINATALPNSTSCATAASGDFDGDGRVDVAAGAQASPSGIRVLLNRTPSPWSLFGTGCAGSNGTPRLALVALVVPGATYGFDVESLPTAAGLVAVTMGFSRTMAPGIGALPASMTRFGAPGCTVWCDAPGVVLLPHAGGRGAFRLNVPRTPVLTGVVFFQQAYSLDRAANALGIAASAAAQVVVQ